MCSDRVRLWRRWRRAAVLVAGMSAAGCAGHRRAADLVPASSELPPVCEVTPEAEAAEILELPPVCDLTLDDTTAPPQSRRLRDFCRQLDDGALLDDTRRVLEETFCGAVLWFDGLFGGEPDIENARAVSGRVELSGLYTEFAGFDPEARLHLRYDLPNLEHRVNVFLNRDDRDDFVADRREGLAIRSAIFGLEQEDQWLAGLGYAPPARWARKLDFRSGGKLKSAPEVFVQGRYRHNIFQGERAVWRLRDTVFWENREGAGFTSSLEYDRVVRQDLIARCGAIGTISESTEGVVWRAAVVVYHNLKGSHAIAGELFARGITRADVKLREYGPRMVYRRPIGKPYLFGEVIIGYTWPRELPDEPRDGSAMVGVGIELLFGRDPF